MVRLTILVAALFALVSASNTFAQAESNLAGQWQVTWDNDSRNAMSLALTGERFSGNYINDDNSSCSVSGNFDPTGRRIALQIVCPNWDIRMEGSASSDGSAVEGTYRAYIDTTGNFVMNKQ